MMEQSPPSIEQVYQLWPERTRIRALRHPQMYVFSYGEVFGEALHEELGLLVEAGLTPVEALRAATVTPAAYFGLTDRGVIEAGRRADLLLVDGDPTKDITATRAIQGVWVAGVQVR